LRSVRARYGNSLSSCTRRGRASTRTYVSCVRSSASWLEPHSERANRRKRGRCAAALWGSSVVVGATYLVEARGLRRGGHGSIVAIHTSMCEPMITVRSRGRPKYSAASAVICAVAMNNRLRHGAIVGAAPRRSSILERK
jgi:hypothetical protein